MSAQTLLELLRSRERSQPLIVYHSHTLPVTPDETVSAAIAAGRTVLHVRFVAASGQESA